MKNQIKEKYNATASRYISLREKRPYWLYPGITHVKNYLNKNTDVDLVLDLGCGSGTLIRQLAPKYPNIQFVGVDFSEELIKIGKNENHRHNLKLLIQDITQLSPKIHNYLAASSHTLLLSFGTLAYYHTEDQVTQAHIDIWKSIKKGAIIFSFHNRELVGRSIFKNKLKKYWTSGEAIEAFKQGRTKQQVSYFSFLPLDIVASRLTKIDKILILLDKNLAKISRLLNRFSYANFILILQK